MLACLHAGSLIFQGNMNPIHGRVTMRCLIGEYYIVSMKEGRLPLYLDMDYFIDLAIVVVQVYRRRCTL